MPHPASFDEHEQLYDFEAPLFDELHQAALRTGAPTQAPRVPRPPRARARAGVAITAVAAAAAAAFTVSTESGGPVAAHHAVRSAAQAPSVTAPGHVPAPEDAAYVVRRMLTAAQADDAIVEDIVHAPDSETGAPTYSELWSQHGNPTSLDIDLDAAGRPQTATLLTRGTDATTSTTIDYAAHTYATRTYPPDTSGGPGPAPATLSGYAEQLRAEVAAGQATLVGPATVDGRRTLEILSRTDQGTIQIYVDPDSYLPVREVDVPLGGSVTGPSTITDDSRYLPDTAANLAKLTPAGAIPPGFQKAG